LPDRPQSENTAKAASSATSMARASASSSRNGLTATCSRKAGACGDTVKSRRIRSYCRAPISSAASISTSSSARATWTTGCS
jgi:hypothetical protein